MDIVTCQILGATCFYPLARGQFCPLANTSERTFAFTPRTDPANRTGGLLSRRLPSVVGRPKARGNGALLCGVPVPESPARRSQGIKNNAIRCTRRCSWAPAGWTCRSRAARGSALACLPKRTNAAARLECIRNLFWDPREWEGDISVGTRQH